MLLANQCAANKGRTSRVPFVYRTHQAPEAEKLDRLKNILTACNLNAHFAGETPTQQELAKLLDETRGTPLECCVHTSILRSMGKAKYEPDPKGHFGLALSDYTHFTSPIRRYPDLAIHRILSDLVAGEEPELLARRKARAALACAPGRLIVAADTLVAVDGTALGKPKSREEACAMLRRLSGRTHQVYTGVCVLRGEKCLSFTQCTQVTFYPLSEEEIRRYADTGEPMDKAGAYGIQGRGALLAEKIDGDYFNVVGLPVARLARALSDMAAEG